jgi:hypothetical protein
MVKTAVTVASLFVCFNTIQTQVFAAVIGNPQLFASGAALGANINSPDSITIGNGSVWVSYTNGAASDGSNGSSLVVQYSLSGAVQKTYTIAGYVDGLKIDPATGLVWALQNQDANSSLTIIDPIAQTTQTLSYAVNSLTSGYDDVVFKGTQKFLSFTNPAAATDPTVVLLTNSSSPLTVSPILHFGDPGTIQNDPDSMKLTPSGDLLLTSGADGALNFIVNPGGPGQTVHSIALNDLAGDPFSGLDDTLYPTYPIGLIFVTNTAANQVLSINASGLSLSSLYAAVGNTTVNAIGTVDPTTGLFTTVVSGLNRPHGLAFLPTPEPGTLFLVLGGILIGAGALRIRKRGSSPQKSKK